MTDHQSQTLEFDVTLEDIIHFNRYHFTKSEYGKKLILKNQVTFSSIMMVMSIYFSFDKQDWAFFMPAGIIASLIYALLAKKEILRRTEKNVRQMFKGDANRVMLGIHHVEIQDDGICIRGQSSEAKVHWNGLSQIAQDEHYAYIYIGSIKALVIKKSSVATEQLEAFLDSIKKHIP